MCYYYGMDTTFRDRLCDALAVPRTASDGALLYAAIEAGAAHRWVHADDKLTRAFAKHDRRKA